MSVEWMVIRGSGVVAFSMLAASTIWGLLLTTKLFGRLVKAKPLTWFHESLAVGALLATLVHMFALSIHDFVPFDWAEILIPGRSDWRPMAVAFGVVAFYGAAILSLSFYLKRFIGHSGWRALHFTSYGAFFAAALHGVLAGTDTGEPWIAGIYAGSIGAVVLLVVVRLAQHYAPPQSRRSETGQPDGARSRQTAISPERPAAGSQSAHHRVADSSRP